MMIVLPVPGYNYEIPKIRSGHLGAWVWSRKVAPAARLSIRQRNGHKPTLITLELVGHETGIQLVEMKMRKLRFNAVDTRDCGDRLDDVFEQSQGLVESPGVRRDEQVPDQTFLALIKKKAIAFDFACINQCVSLKAFLFKARGNQSHRRSVVPTKAGIPDARLRLEQRQKLAGVELADIDNLRRQDATSPSHVSTPIRMEETPEPGKKAGLTADAGRSSSFAQYTALWKANDG